jgi:pimeloyl-ACP methyl ester carboxylesterase
MSGVETVRSADGTTIAFERVGEGPPAILVGGALTDRAALAPLAALLAPSLTAVAYDRRGRGDSGDTPPYAVEREVEDLAALIAAAGGSASLFGHSSGAALALEAAAGALPVTRLALYEPPFVVDDSRPPLSSDYVERLTELAATGRRGDAVELFMIAGAAVPPEMVAGMRASPMWPAMELLAHTLSYDGAVMADRMRGGPLSSAWTSITVPTLVMDGGEASPPWQHAAVEALADLLPNAERRSFPGAGHGVEPGVLAPVLIGFLAD